MSEPFIGEIRMFAGNFAPRGWAFCDGQLLAVSQSDALFSLLGTIYGGDGETTFGLPDMRGRIPIHAGSGPGLSPRRLGAKGGAESVTITANQLPSHTHRAIDTPPFATQDQADSTDASELPAFNDTAYSYSTSTGSSQTLGGNTADVGGSRSHTNLMPFLCINFIISLFGIYPSQH